MTLWHYTCDHSYAQIDGWLKPGEWLTVTPTPWTADLVWLTDLDYPDRDGLGLTNHLRMCDRTARRFRVLDESGCIPWMTYRRTLSSRQREQLESAPGALPRHWWISEAVVEVTYDPPTERAEQERRREEASR